MLKYDCESFYLQQGFVLFFGEELVEESEEQQLPHFGGEVKVFVQMFFTKSQCK